MRSTRSMHLLGAVPAGLAVAAPARAQQSARLNRAIEVWEQGNPAFGSFARLRDADGARSRGTSERTSPRPPPEDS